MTDEQKYQSANILFPYLQEKLKEYQEQMLAQIPNSNEEDLVKIKYKYQTLLDVFNMIEQDIITQQLKEMKLNEKKLKEKK